MFQIVREAGFAARLRAARIRAGKYQSEIAEELGLSRQHVNNWEKGYCKPKRKRLEQLARAVEADATWLQHGEGSEIEDRIETVNALMRIVVRELEHLRRMMAAQKKAPPGSNHRGGRAA